MKRLGLLIWTLALASYSFGSVDVGPVPAITQLSGDVTAIGPGNATATVNSIVGATATSAAVNSTIMKRDSSAGFAAATGQLTTLQLNANGHNIQTVGPAGLGVNYTFTMPTTPGNSGQVMQSDGSGTMTWTTPLTNSALTSARKIITAKTVADNVCSTQTTLSGIQTCDGVTVGTSDIVFAKGQTDPTQNGLYLENDGGAWARTADVSGIFDLQGALISVDSYGGGTNYQKTLWFGTGDGSSTATFSEVPVISAFVSGGIPYFSSTTQSASSGLLASNGVVLGGGAGSSPTTTTAGTANQVLRVPSAGGAPAFGSIQLASSAAVTGTLTVANGGTGDTSFTSNAVVVGNSTSGLNIVTNNGTATNEFLTQSSSGAPAWATILATDVPSLAASKITSGTLAVAQGGTNLASGTSGGILGYTATGTIASSALLTANGVVLGGGAGVTPSSTSAGTSSQVLRVPDAGGAPAFGAINLASGSAVTGTLPATNMTAATSSTAGTISYEATGTFTATFTGPCSSGSLTIKYTRLAGIAALLIPSFTCTSSSGTNFTASAALPGSLTPSASSAPFAADIESLGAIPTTPGMILIRSSSNIEIYLDFNSGNFSATGVVGLSRPALITYLLN